MSNNNGNGRHVHGASVKRLNKKFYKFYFLQPPENVNADHIAEQLIDIKNVEEVYVTDGDYGFVVKTRFFRNLMMPSTSYQRSWGAISGR